LWGFNTPCWGRRGDGDEFIFLLLANPKSIDTTDIKRLKWYVRLLCR
jgi:hypothetical protein